MADAYAIVETGGKQYRAEKGTTLLVDRLPDDEGAKVALRPVFFNGDDGVVVDAPGLEKVKVEATVAEHLRGEKIRIFKYRAKKGYRKRQGHRSALTKLEIVDVKQLTRKPAASKQQAASSEDKPAPKKPAAKATAAKKPAAKAPAKKPAAKKPAAKKPAAKKEGDDGS